MKIKTPPCKKSASKDQQPRRLAIEPGSLVAEVIGTCICGKPATILCKRGISPGKWTRGKKRCEECWKLELPAIPEND